MNTMTAERPKVSNQGKVIVECHDGEWFVMMPDGSIETSATKEGAEKAARRWFKANMDNDAINVGAIEWR